MAHQDLDPFGQGLAAHGGKNQGFAPVVVIELLPRLILAAGVKGGVPLFFQDGDGRGHRFPLGFALIQKGFVVLAELVGQLHLFLRKLLTGVFSLQKQFLFQQFAPGFLFAHNRAHPFYSNWYSSR